MDLDVIPQNRINDIEQTTTQLLKKMQKSKLHHLPLYTALQDFEKQLGEERRQRFDKDNSEYRGY